MEHSRPWEQEKDRTKRGGGWEGAAWKEAEEAVAETRKEGRRVGDESGEVNRTKTF